MPSLFAARIKSARPTRDEAARLRFVYVPYDRLTTEVGPLSRSTPRESGVVLIESSWKAGRRPYHKQKLALLLSNQRHFALELAARGWRIFYLFSEASFGETLRALAARKGLRGLCTTRSAERELRVDLDAARARGLVLEELPDESWLTREEEFQRCFPKGPPYRMDRFYKAVRQRTGLLMERGKPLGGSYSHDAENRKPWRGEPPAPERPVYPIDEITAEVLALIERRYPNHFGSLAGFNHPTSAADAERAFAFARTLLPLFGPYEDAMSSRSRELFHSKLSPLVNLGRILPRRLVACAAEELAAGRVPLASAEGFIRQLLGWREFVRHVHAATDGFRTLDANGAPDALGATLPLPPAFWGTPSGMSCLDTVVSNVLSDGYSHHITRLMVLGNLATLAGFSPRQLADWFWIAYVDAYDWVVEPNVLGMATFADGGLMTTKPYVSGAAYIDKMSDHCKGCALDPKRSTGPKACPMTALYWSFLWRNRERLRENQRLALPLAAVARKSEAERAALQEVASAAIAALQRGERIG